MGIQGIPNNLETQEMAFRAKPFRKHRVPKNGIRENGFERKEGSKSLQLLEQNITLSQPPRFQFPAIRFCKTKSFC